MVLFIKDKAQKINHLPVYVATIQKRELLSSVICPHIQDRTL